MRTEVAWYPRPDSLLSPILVVLVLMVGFRWGGATAGRAGWFTALVVTLLFFGPTPELIAYSQVKAVLLTLYVLYIVWMPLLLFNVVNETGAIEAIGAGIAPLAGDRVMQVLFLERILSDFGDCGLLYRGIGWSGGGAKTDPCPRRRHHLCCRPGTPG